MLLALYQVCPHVCQRYYSRLEIDGFSQCLTGSATITTPGNTPPASNSLPSQVQIIGCVPASGLFAWLSLQSSSISWAPMATLPTTPAVKMLSSSQSTAPILPPQPRPLLGQTWWNALSEHAKEIAVVIGGHDVFLFPVSLLDFYLIFGCKEWCKREPAKDGTFCLHYKRSG